MDRLRGRWQRAARSIAEIETYPIACRLFGGPSVFQRPGEIRGVFIFRYPLRSRLRSNPPSSSAEKPRVEKALHHFFWQGRNGNGRVLTPPYFDLLMFYFKSAMRRLALALGRDSTVPVGSGDALQPFQQLGSVIRPLNVDTMKK